MKKMLMVATVPSMIGQFNMNNIDILQNIGYKVHVACDFTDCSVWSKERTDEFIRLLNKNKISYHQIDFSRNPINLKRGFKSYRQLNNLVKSEKFDFIHCHTPVASVIARIVAHNRKIKIIYTAHGFHFFNGAPKKNWIIYYPIEKFLSRWTDMIITINHEDYERAKKKFHAKKVEYIPGVGVDTSRFKGCSVTKAEKRKQLGIPDDAFVLLSVGELSSRKNHQAVIKALGRIADSSIYYLIAGQGEDYHNYKSLANSVGIGERIILLGDRTDVDELCVAADVFVHPSVREGLGIAPLEGMAAGLPLISTYVNGIKDYTENGVSGVCVKEPLDVEEMKHAILRMKDDEKLRASCASNNRKTAEQFSLMTSKAVMNGIYEKIPRGGIVTL